MLGDDAVKLSEELDLELTKFTKDCNKCGFPITKLKRYTKFIELLGYDYEIVLSAKEQVIEDIMNIDLDSLTIKEAYEKIKSYKEVLSCYQEKTSLL